MGRRFLGRMRSYCNYQTSYMFERVLANDETPAPRHGAPFVGMHVISDYRAIERLLHDGYDLGRCPFFAQARTRLCDRTALFLVFSEKKLVHASWAFWGDAPNTFDRIFRRIGDKDTGYIGPCYTEEGYRGKGIYPRVLHEICLFLRTKGLRRALINTKRSNAASVRGIVKAHFIQIAQFSATKLFRWEFYRIRPDSRKGAADHALSA